MCLWSVYDSTMTKFLFSFAWNSTMCTLIVLLASRLAPKLCFHNPKVGWYPGPFLICSYHMEQSSPLWNMTSPCYCFILSFLLKLLFYGHYLYLLSICLKELFYRFISSVLLLKFLIIYGRKKFGLTMLSCLLIRYQYLGPVQGAGAWEVDRLHQLPGWCQANHLHRHR